MLMNKFVDLDEEGTGSGHSEAVALKRRPQRRGVSLFIRSGSKGLSVDRHVSQAFVVLSFTDAKFRPHDVSRLPAPLEWSAAAVGVIPDYGLGEERAQACEASSHVQHGPYRPAEQGICSKALRSIVGARRTKGEAPGHSPRRSRQAVATRLWRNCRIDLP